MAARGRRTGVREGPIAEVAGRLSREGADPFAARVVAWQACHGRHDLPWQNTRDPYRIWLSEIMLQQTQVSAVVGYYARFLETCPDVASLAAADASEVMRLWSGLGYYSRARNLHRAARIIVDDMGGQFPEESERLQTLPGVGRSTAAAIAAFAFGARAAILDGNVKRVFARHFGIAGYPGTPSVEAAMWRKAEELLPLAGIEAYTQGLMDLGATVCTRTRPRCEACPLRDTCVARAEDRIGELPQPKPRKPLPHRACVMLVLQNANCVLLERRPPSGIWGGLLCLPQADDHQQAKALAERLGGDWATRREYAAIEHGFTHYHLTIRPVHVALTGRRAGEIREPGSVWLDPTQAQVAGVPAPVRKLLEMLVRPDLFA